MTISGLDFFSFNVLSVETLVLQLIFFSCFVIYTIEKAFFLLGLFVLRARDRQE